MIDFTILRSLPDWDLLVACLSPTKSIVQLTVEDDEAARVLCDGFGEMSAAMLWNLEATFDWSHVRDSSERAIRKAAAFIREPGRLENARARS
ncbi:MAG: hypothetical protein V3W32_08760 [Gemmatimonadota bacterium]